MPIKHLPASLREHLVKGRELYNQEKLVEAEKELRIIADSGKFHAPSQYLLAVTEERLGHKDLAEKYITPVIKKRGPYQVWGYNLMGQINEKLGKTDEAIRFYEKAFDLLPSHVPFVEKLISIKNEQKDFRGVERLLRNHIIYDVRNIEKWKHLLEIYKNLNDTYHINLCEINIKKLNQLGI